MRSTVRAFAPVAIILLLTLSALSQRTPVLKSKAVIFGPFKQYVHPDKSFSIDLPNNWKVNDSTTPTEAIIKVMDPTTNAALVIHVWDHDGELAGGNTGFLKEFLRTSVAALPNYSQGEPKEQKDGSVGIYFKYDQTVQAGTFPMWGDSFIQRQGTRVGMLFFIIPKEQYDLKTKAAYRLINSFQLAEN